MQKTKVGLMLGGGGSKGAYQIGVLKALKEHDLLKFVKVMSGTSIGAINTLLFMVNPSWDLVDEVWHKINNDGVYGEGLHYSPKRHALISLEPLYEVLKKKVTAKKVHKASIIGYATAAQLLSKTHNFLTQLLPSRMQEVHFRLNDLEDPHEAVLASASIPVLFGITHINGIPYVDGGALNNYPVSPLIDENCNMIWSIAVDGRFHANDYDNLDINIVDFTAKEAFSKSIIVDFVQSIIFTDDVKDVMFKLGYQSAQFMVEKMKNEGLIQSNKTRTYLRKKEGFHAFGLSKDEEEAIKRLRHGIKDDENEDE